MPALTATRCASGRSLAVRPSAFMNMFSPPAPQGTISVKRAVSERRKSIKGSNKISSKAPGSGPAPAPAPARPANFSGDIDIGRLALVGLALAVLTEALTKGALAN